MERIRDNQDVPTGSCPRRDTFRNISLEDKQNCRKVQAQLSALFWVAPSTSSHRVASQPELGYLQSMRDPCKRVRRQCGRITVKLFEEVF